jgi:peptidoglycan/LPS O-acetylase OafA/YrhL
MQKTYINSLRGLDLLRFILSVSVIIWHYQHFFYPHVSFEERELFLQKQPFYSIFELFYTHGYYAVQVFWLISGVIFYKVYQDRISTGKVTFPQFFLNRFSRLYPLHLFTLLLVVVLQQLYFSDYGSYFIYDKNSVQSFFQNILFVQAWGSNRLSFNGPTWSVSIEIMVYFIFFAVCASGLIRTAKGLLGTFLFFLMVKKWELLFAGDDLASSIYLFFAGCMLIKVYENIKHRSGLQFGILIGLFASWYFTQHTPRVIAPLYERITGYLYPDLLTFSCLVVWAFIVIFNLEIFDGIANKIFQYFGDMTYSTYLTHFPVQLCFYLLIRPTSYVEFFSPVIFLTYMLTVFVVGRLVYRYFELPIQNKLRALISTNV